VPLFFPQADLPLPIVGSLNAISDYDKFFGTTSMQRQLEDESGNLWYATNLPGILKMRCFANDPVSKRNGVFRSLNIHYGLKGRSITANVSGFPSRSSGADSCASSHSKTN
jgi:hypothetical protein